MIKIIGLCIVLFAICYICRSIEENRRHRAVLVERLCVLLDYIREGIALYMRPLPELYSAFDWSYLSEYGCPDALSSGRAEEDARPLWESVGEESAHILVPLFNSLGEHSYTEELSLLDSARGRMADLLASERAGSHRTGRLVRTLGLSLSLAIIILVI